MKHKTTATLLAVVALLLLAVPAVTAQGNPVGYPNWTAGNAAAECAALPGDYTNGYKVDGWDEGDKNDTYDGITISNSNGYTFDWSATHGIGAVIVKAATGANVWFYDPQVMSDTGLYAYDNKEISHVTFCWNIPTYVPLTATKSAAGTYDRTVTWSLSKSVDIPRHTGTAGEVAGSSTWTVVATKTDTGPYNYQVTGSIIITNPNSIDVNFSVSDSMPGATITCPGYTVQANSSITCTYTAPGNPTITSNTVTIASLTEGVGGTSATANFSYAEQLSGSDTMTLIDEHLGYNQSISATTTLNVPETFSCPANPTLYSNGSYSYTVPNTATLNGMSASATVDVTCTLPALVPSKDAAGTYDRTVTWTLDKSVAPAVLNGYSNEAAGSVIWTVVADKTETLGNYQANGTITIANPAAIPQTFTISDGLDDGTVATVTCPSNTVPAGSSITCTYTALPADKTATSNTVTVTAPGNLPQPFTFSPIVWTENLIGYDSGTLSDPRFDFSQMISGDTTQTFDETFYCPSYWGNEALYASGTYTYTEENWAYLNGNIGLEDSAEVTVNCQIGYDYETAYAMGDPAQCFIPTIANWGWTNPISDPFVGTWDLWAGAAQCDTTKGMLVGSVSISYAGGELGVVYNVVFPYTLDETHVYAGSDPFPVNKKGRIIVAPGQYYIEDPLSGEIYVIAHAVVGIPQ